jgi:protein ImuA
MDIGAPTLTPSPFEHLLRAVPRLWRGDRLPLATGPAAPTGFPELDGALPGSGWPMGAVVELLGEVAGIGELRLLLPVLQRLTQAGNHVLLVNPPHVPNAVVLQHAGVALGRVLVARPGQEQDAAWLAEQALRNPGCGAVLIWPRQGSRVFNDERVRRLQVAAETGQSTLFLYRGCRRHVSQWAALRLELLPATDAGSSSAFLRVSVLKAVGTHRRPQVQLRI